MAIENIKELGAQIEGCIFPPEPRFLAEGEILVARAVESGAGEGARFVSKREGSRYGERIRVPERSGVGVEAGALVGLRHAGNYVDARGSCKVAAGKQDIAGGATARAVHLGGLSGCVHKNSG